MKGREKVTALVLRKQGMSIKDISLRLGVSPGTTSRWCANVILTEPQKQYLIEKRKEAGRRALAPYIKRNIELKRSDIEKQSKAGKEDVGNMDFRELLFLGLGLYWGEGYKRGSQECGFTNSDPKLMRTILAWFNTCYDVETERINARVTINSLYKKQEKRIVQEWSTETHIPLSQFSRSTFIEGYGKAAKNPREYRGTLRIKVRNGTSLRRRILASIAHLP